MVSSSREQKMQQKKKDASKLFLVFVTPCVSWCREPLPCAFVHVV